MRIRPIPRVVIGLAILVTLAAGQAQPPKPAPQAQPGPARFSEDLLTGQVTSGDFAPTTPQREVHQLLHDQAKSYRQQFDQLVATDLAAFNTMLGQKSMAGVVAKP